MSTPYNPKNRTKPLQSPGGKKAPELARSDLSRVLPRQLSTGSTRGTQTVGYGDTKIDGSNNRISVGDSILLDGNSIAITVTNDDGKKVGMGLIPDGSGQFGFFAMDADGNVIATWVGPTLLVNDTVNDRVVLGESSGAF